MDNRRHGQSEVVTRRTFLGYAAGGIMSFMGVVLSGLGLGAFLDPVFKPREAGELVKLGRVEEFTSGVPRKVDFVVYATDGWMEASPSPKSAWVVRGKGDEFTVFNSRCTHLGCIVDWKTQQGEPFSTHHWKGPAFYSPCHAGVFTLDGEVINGPPPRPLDTLYYEVKDGELYCRYVDFVVGISGKKPV